MKEMRQGDRSRPEERPSGLGRSGRARTEDAENLAPARPERENPFDAPLVLLDAADSSITDQLEVVVRRIEQLPEAVQSSALKNDRYFETVRLEDLRDFWSGLLNLHNNRLPTRDELSIIASPHNMLREIADGLRDAVESESISFELARSIETDIADPLAAIAERYLPGPACSLAEDWADETTNRRYSSAPDVRTTDRPPPAAEP